MNFDSESDVAGPKSYSPIQDVAEFLTASNRTVKVEEKSSANLKDLCRRRRHRLRRFCRSTVTTSFKSKRIWLKNNKII